MRLYRFGMAKYLLVAFAVLTLHLGVARADEVEVAGTTGGCLGASPCAPPSTGQTQQDTLHGLMYSGSIFDVTTVNGFAGIGDTGNSGSNTNNLGSLSLDATSFDYTGNTLTLRVDFSLPGGTTPRFANYVADIFGTVRGASGGASDGGIQLAFRNPTQTFNFSGGTLTLSVNNLAITGGQGPVALTGNVRAASTVPEPATLLLLGSGLSGLAAIARRRFKV